MGILTSNISERSRHYSHFRGVDFSNDHSQINPQRLAYLVNMYRDYQSGQGEALETIAGFRRRADFSVKISVTEEGIANPPTDNAEGLKLPPVYGIFYANFRNKITDIVEKHVLVHRGTKLYRWKDYPYSLNTLQIKTLVSPEVKQAETSGYAFLIEIDAKVAAIKNISIYTADRATGFYGTFMLDNSLIRLSQNSTPELAKIEFKSEVNNTYVFDNNMTVYVEYYESILMDSDILYGEMNEAKSKSVIFSNRLYIIDKKNYIVYDGEKITSVVYKKGEPCAAFAPPRNEYYWENGKYLLADGNEGRKPATHKLNKNMFNMLSPQFVIYYDTSTINNDTDGKIVNPVQDSDPTRVIDDVSNVYYDGVEKTDFTFDKSSNTLTLQSSLNGIKELKVIAVLEKNIGASGVDDDLPKVSDLIALSQYITTYDGKIFVAGCPYAPNHLFWCSVNPFTGFVDPTFFGNLNFQVDGVGLAPISGLLCVADTLMVLKQDTQQDSSIYYHTPLANPVESDLTELNPTLYPSVQGLSGLGCIGDCRNFLDDPIFISRLGVEAVAQLSVRLERAVEHRSRLVDVKLVNDDLKNAYLEEWGGYLCLLIDDKMFLADSRQRFPDETGIIQYEWYYIEGLATYKGQYQDYLFYNAEEIPSYLNDVRIDVGGLKYPLEIGKSVYNTTIGDFEDMRGKTVNVPDSNGLPTEEIFSTQVEVYLTDEAGDKIPGSEFYTQIYYWVHTYENDAGENETHVYLCNTKGDFIGGEKHSASVLKNLDDNLFFGGDNGVICSFNFDQRNEYGELPTQAYSFDNRIINCGCATKMDNCDIPHLTKSTVKRSTVIKTKAFQKSGVKIKVRTNNKPYNQIARINSSTFTFNNVDFSDLSFNMIDDTIFPIKEKEKQWVEKQYYMYSDEYQSPFSLYSVSYRYKIIGRVK